MSLASQPSGALRIDRLAAEDGLHVWSHHGLSDRLVLCFSGIGANAEQAPGYEFARAATGNGADTTLFFSDPKRSWLNAPGLIDQIVWWVEEAKARLNPQQIVTIGHSMGGFAAAVISGFTRVDVAVCFSPQATIHPVLARDDVRWMQWRDQIGQVTIRTAADHLGEETLCYALFGRHSREAPQRERFPIRDNVRFYVLPKTVHNTPQRLKQAGVLDEVVRFAFRGRKGKVDRILKSKFNALRLTEPTEAMVARAKDDATAMTLAA